MSRVKVRDTVRRLHFAQEEAAGTAGDGGERVSERAGEAGLRVRVMQWGLWLCERAGEAGLRVM